MTKNLQPIRGFRDLYPQDKVVQNYILDKLKNTAALFGYEPYDGPILEPIEIYLGKTAEELIKRQTFQITNQKEQTLIMRPEMTPTLARMIAAKEQQLTFPLRLFNLGPRFRLEAPQKGREREFYQADFDLLGSESVLSDAEILNVAVNIFLQFGAADCDFVLYVNSRTAMQKKLAQLGVPTESLKDVIGIVDKKERVSRDTFVKMLTDQGISKDLTDKIIVFLEQPSTYDESFGDLLSLLAQYEIDQYVQINPSIVRGLDYYTGLVFEVKEKGEMRRSLLGGGRYDNLITDLGALRKIPGVGFATSDVVLWEFLKNKNLLPQINPKPTRVLVTVFPGEKASLSQSIAITNFLRKNQISAELYPETDTKLDKQLKYADRNNIPFVIIVGPEEMKNNVLKLKNMQTKEQKIITEKELISSLKS